MASHNRRARKLAARKRVLTAVIQAANLVGVTVGDIVHKAADVAGIQSRAIVARLIQRLRNAYLQRDFSGFRIPQWMQEFAESVIAATSPARFFHLVRPADPRAPAV